MFLLLVLACGLVGRKVRRDKKCEGTNGGSDRKEETGDVQERLLDNEGLLREGRSALRSFFSRDG